MILWFLSWKYSPNNHSTHQWIWLKIQSKQPFYTSVNLVENTVQTTILHVSESGWKYCPNNHSTHQWIWLKIVQTTILHVSESGWKYSPNNHSKRQWIWLKILFKAPFYTSVNLVENTVQSTILHISESSWTYCSKHHSTHQWIWLKILFKAPFYTSVNLVENALRRTILHISVGWFSLKCSPKHRSIHQCWLIYSSAKFSCSQRRDENQYEKVLLVNSILAWTPASSTLAGLVFPETSAVISTDKY